MTVLTHFYCFSIPDLLLGSGLLQWRYTQERLTTLFLFIAPSHITTYYPISIQVFSQPLYYNRLTGTFVEVEGSHNPLTGRLSLPETPPYGATDEERERMLEWAREERLPFFLRYEYNLRNICICT